MLDLKFVRENPDIVKQNIKNKFQDSKLPLVDEVIALDAENRTTQKEADDLRASRNKLSKQIGALMGQGKKEEAEEVKKQVSANSARLTELEAKLEDFAAKVKDSDQYLTIRDGVVDLTQKVNDKIEEVKTKVLDSSVDDDYLEAFENEIENVEEKLDEMIEEIKD